MQRSAARVDSVETCRSTAPWIWMLLVLPSTYHAHAGGGDPEDNYE